MEVECSCLPPGETEALFKPKCLISIISDRIKYGAEVRPYDCYKSLSQSPLPSSWPGQRSSGMKLGNLTILSNSVHESMYEASFKLLWPHTNAHTHTSPLGSTCTGRTCQCSSLKSDFVQNSLFPSLNIAGSESSPQPCYFIQCGVPPPQWSSSWNEIILMLNMWSFHVFWPECEILQPVFFFSFRFNMIWDYWEKTER